ncbi:MAG TPA: DUF1573 domain-containing protein [Candidatus Hydrogenedentes bacterium]|nr:DUF1573 domain-containing protein [Candidatus Hydrogenedentota bacterium]
MSASRLLCVVTLSLAATLSGSEHPEAIGEAAGQGESGVSIENCGLTACAFILQACHHEYSVEVLTQLLAAEQPSLPGVSLASMVRALEAHRLKVQARKNIPFPSIQNWLARSPDHYVIFGTPPPPDPEIAGIGHASVIAGLSDGAFVLEDLWNRRSLSWAQLKGRFEHESDWVALLVSRLSGEDKAYGETPLRIVPFVLDLGRLERGKTHNEIVAVENMTARPLAIVRATTGCSCAQLLVPDKYLPPGATIHATVQVEADKWGAGTHARSLFLFLADGTSARIQVSAMSPTRSALRSHPAALRVFVGHGGPVPPVTRTLEITGLPPDARDDALSASCSAPWAEAQVDEDRSRPGTTSFTVRIHPPEAMDASARTYRAQIHIQHPLIEHALVVPITLERDNTFYCSPSVIFLRRATGSGTVEMRRLKDTGRRFRIVAIETPSYLEATYSEDWVDNVARIPYQFANQNGQDGQLPFANLSICCEEESAGDTPAQQHGISIPVIPASSVR